MHLMIFGRLGGRVTGGSGGVKRMGGWVKGGSGVRVVG